MGTVGAVAEAWDKPGKPAWWEGIKLCHEWDDRERWARLKNDGSVIAMSASEAAVVLQEPHGKHPPHQTREELAEVKRGEAESTFVQNEAMYWGTVLEPLVVKRLQELHPDDGYEPFGWLCSDRVQPLMAATPDALRLRGGEWIPCQVKVSAYFPSTFEKHGIPMPWQLQMQVEIAVLDTPGAELAVLHLTKRELHRYTVPRDDKLIAVLRSAAQTFKHDYIDKGAA